MAKKNKNKGPAKPRNDGTRLTSFADLLKDKATEETPSAQNKKKIPYDLSYPEHPVFFSTDYFLNCYNFIPYMNYDLSLFTPMFTIVSLILIYPLLKRLLLQ